jgi:hypothetical protein
MALEGVAKGEREEKRLACAALWGPALKHYYYYYYYCYLQ